MTAHKNTGKTHPSLSLKRQTLRELTTADLRHIAAGTSRGSNQGGGRYSAAGGGGGGNI